ncbi:MAG: cofactor-independent phosphoglycerate mutase, partial [Clostridiales bacterium]|nr:cofactor-independent phosphoglycerate mutase [Clostridiales bacterium]
MKFVTILFDGMADLPDENGQTPMSLAHKPVTDTLAAKAEVGLCATVPEGFKPGSDVANLSVMGYDPRDCYTGRSPLEALSIGIPLDEHSVTYRCNLVTLSDESNYADKTMADYSAGEISTEEARTLIEYLDGKLSTPALKFYAGVSYRHCVKRQSGTTGALLTPPHDISDRKIGEWLPRGAYADELNELMQKSYELLKDHPVNRARIAQGKNPANSIWLWGEGTKPGLQNFTQFTGLRGAVISAVDLIKGIAIGAGMHSIDVAGATGTLATNFAGKAKAAIDALKSHDFVYVHLEAPDECGHQGDKAGKIRAIERIDEEIVRPVVTALENSGEDFKILILPD